MLEIVTFPDPILNKVCRPLTDEEISGGKVGPVNLPSLIDEMARLMKQDNGVGLAAPQIGLDICLFVMALPTRDASALVFINPEISTATGESEMVEGCLSLPGVRISVKRPTSIHVKAKNAKGVDFEIDVDDDRARVIQHEFDHLQGKLILTRGNINGYRKNKEILDNLEKVYKRWEERKKQTAASKK